MTNGEKFQQIFAVSKVDECDLNVYAWLPCHDAIEIPLEWWNTNYSEIPTGSTTKNDLGVDAVSRQTVIDLMMQKWGENFSGDDAMQESIDAIRALPSVTPQEPKIVSIAEIKYDKDKLKELMNKAVLTVTPQQPKTGHWNDIPKYTDIAWECSECGRFTTLKHNYCPMCGAKMVEPQESEE